MAAPDQLDSVYMGTAILHSRLSSAVRSKVGAVMVTASGVTITGYNGTYTGGPNICENTVYSEYGKYELVTKPEVIHAELNCVLKAAREGVSILGSKVYITLSPCVHCSSLLIQSGVSEVVYNKEYRDTSGIDILKSSGITVRQYELE